MGVLIYHVIKHWANLEHRFMHLVLFGKWLECSMASLSYDGIPELLHLHWHPYSSMKSIAIWIVRVVPMIDDLLKYYIFDFLWQARDKKVERLYLKGILSICQPSDSFLPFDVIEKVVISLERKFATVLDSFLMFFTSNLNRERDLDHRANCGFKISYYFFLSNS